MANEVVFSKFGKFTISPGREVSGELRVAGRKTSLYLRDDEIFDPRAIPDGCLVGTLHDLTKVTMVQCICPGAGSSSRGAERYWFANLFPHYVLEGHSHLNPNENNIEDITLVIEDVTSVFHDFDAFSLTLRADPHLAQIVEDQAKKLNREIPIGPDGLIAYFTGKSMIIEVDTALGKVRAQHNPGGTFGGPHGVKINNVISLTIEPEAPVAFEEAITRTLRLLRFLEMVIGRPQNITDLTMTVRSGDHSESLKVHWSYRPHRDPDPSDEERTPSPGEVLLDPIHRPEEFATVLRVWMETYEERQDARHRFHTSFAHQRMYTIDRLVSAANMFDILPSSAVPKDAELTEELSKAKEECRKIFLPLPDSYERQSVLNALGRVGKASLKHKTRFRAQFVVGAVGERFPDMLRVLDEAIDCRNYYVHGTEARMDYDAHFHVVTFFTDTLEFVFAAAELIEAGWNIRNFVDTWTTGSHPFGSYRINYEFRRKALNDILMEKETQ